MKCAIRALLSGALAYWGASDITPGLPHQHSVKDLLRHKRKMLSVLVWHDWKSPLSSGVSSVLRQVNGRVDTFRLDPAATESEAIATFEAAFEPYRFTLILDTNDGSTVNPGVVHALWFHTVPVYNGFFEFSSMFANGVAAWNEANFTLSELLGRLSELNNHIKFMWSYQQILQEVIWYRYAHPLRIRTDYLGTTIAKASGYQLALVGVYSAQQNGGYRDAIRRTWAKSLALIGVDVLFFLSDCGNDETVAAEAALYNDIIRLPVEEGYKHNSRKGLLFLQWIANNRSNYKFLIKADDDIYFRPHALVTQLRSKTPAGYIWGFIDYISPVPKSASSPFFNPRELYPFSVFPTYPRGVVRVTSMDIVLAIDSAARSKKLRMIYGDDPCFGVHLRQIAGASVKSIVIDDFDSYTRFAMEPSCEKSWSSVKNETWAIHHVSPTQILCLWESERAGNFPNCDCL